MLVWNAVIGAVFHADIYSHDNQQGSLTGTLAMPHFLLWVVNYLSCCIVFFPADCFSDECMKIYWCMRMYMYNVHSSLQFVS